MRARHDSTNLDLEDDILEDNMKKVANNALQLVEVIHSMEDDVMRDYHRADVILDLYRIALDIKEFWDAVRHGDKLWEDDVIVNLDASTCDPANSARTKSARKAPGELDSH